MTCNHADSTAGCAVCQAADKVAEDAMLLRHRAIHVWLDMSFELALIAEATGAPTEHLEAMTARHQAAIRALGVERDEILAVIECHEAKVAESDTGWSG